MRYSKQRNLILSILRENPVHPTAEWIFDKAKEEMPSIGVATVYRNLNALVEAGEIIRIPGVKGVDRYDGNYKPHYHMKCVECGRLYDLEPESEDAVQRMEVAIKEAFPMEGAEVRLNTMLMKGTCTDCCNE
ncbi:MAG: transcriptional repressor [Firmicutes bacterium]|nr:transcriptional repressor [Bacillota bacterium]